MGPGEEKFVYPYAQGHKKSQVVHPQELNPQNGAVLKKTGL
jgi:hypothetical protein